MVTQAATASEVAAAVVLAMVWPQLIFIAPAQRSFTGGGGGTQLVHCTVVVRQVAWLPQAALVFQCA